MAETGKPLSRFSVTSYGGGGAEENRVLPDMDIPLMSRAIELLNRIYALEAKMDELYMRPRMEHSDPAWVGFILFFDPQIGDKLAGDRPRWWLPPGLTSDRKTVTSTEDVTGTATLVTKVVYRSKKLEKTRNDIKTKRQVKNINRFVYTTPTPTTSTTTTTTTLSTTTDNFTSFDTISTTTPTTTTTTKTLKSDGVQNIKKTYHFTTGQSWIQTDTETTTSWDNTTFTPGLTTTTAFDTTDDTISTTTIPTSTSSIISTTTNTFTP